MICRRCKGDFDPGPSVRTTLCNPCIDASIRAGVQFRAVCSRCVVYGPCACDICSAPSTHVGQIPQPTFRCASCARHERLAHAKLATQRLGGRME